MSLLCKGKKEIMPRNRGHHDLGSMSLEEIPSWRYMLQHSNGRRGPIGFET